MSLEAEQENQVPAAFDERAWYASELSKVYKHIADRETRWDRRHPIYAQLLNWPIIGGRLRRRRRAFVSKVNFRI